MSGTRIAHRYAKALFLVGAGDVSRVESHRAGLDGMTELFRHRDILKVLISPVMTPELKREVLQMAISQSAIQGDAAADVRGLVESLLAARRVDQIPRIAEAYGHFVDELKNVLRVEIGSVDKLSAADFESITQAIHLATGKTIQGANTVDPEILGGFVVKLANTVVDFSLRSRLEAIAQHVVQ
jgi:F-type H+-transporting ATPase subunit delta